MSFRHFYLFDVPVYRLSKDRYDREREAHIDKVLYPSHNVAFRDHLERSYGGCWRFNKVIGYIRLHFLGSQVRGEYYGINRKRIVRILEYHTWKLAPERNVPFPITSKGVHCTVSDYLEACRAELPGRYIDTDLFEAVAKHINWRKLFLAT